MSIFERALNTTPTENIVKPLMFYLIVSIGVAIRINMNINLFLGG